MAVLTPYRNNSLHALVCLSGTGQCLFKMFGVGGYHDEDDVNLACSKRLLPILGTALANISEFFRTGRHSLSKLPGEAVQGSIRHTQSLESWIGQRNTDPGVR